MNIAEKIITVAENEQKVYDAGCENGYKAYYDFFWDGMQNNGNAANYISRFRRWTNTSIYQPKYNFVHSASASASAQDTFRECFFTDLKADNIFSSVSALSYTFYQAAQLKNARTMHVKSGTTYTSPFYGCTALEEIRFLGTIAKNGLSFSSCTKLSKASMLGDVATDEQTAAGENIITLNGNTYYKGIFGALSDEASGLTITFSKTAVKNAFETSGGAANGTESEEWINLVATKPNWTIALA